MQIAKYNKFIVAVLGALGTVAPLLSPDLAFIGDPEFQAALVATLTPILVLLIGNKDEPEVEVAKEKAKLRRRAEARAARGGA
jgi:hypothetical protein